MRLIEINNAWGHRVREIERSLKQQIEEKSKSFRPRSASSPPRDKVGMPLQPQSAMLQKTLNTLDTILGDKVRCGVWGKKTSALAACQETALQEKKPFYICVQL